MRLRARRPTDVDVDGEVHSLGPGEAVTLLSTSAHRYVNPGRGRRRVPPVGHPAARRSHCPAAVHGQQSEGQDAGPLPRPFEGVWGPLPSGAPVRVSSRPRRLSAAGSAQRSSWAVRVRDWRAGTTYAQPVAASVARRRRRARRGPRRGRRAAGRAHGRRTPGRRGPRARARPGESRGRGETAAVQLQVAGEPLGQGTAEDLGGSGLQTGGVQIGERHAGQVGACLDCAGPRVGPEPVAGEADGLRGARIEGVEPGHQ